MNSDRSIELTERISDAFAHREPLVVLGGGSKDFYGMPVTGGTIIETSGHSGVIKYEPSELVIQARSGTPLVEIETILAGQGQKLGFEPPHFGPAATLGGCVAAGLSGPSRAYYGSVRDFVLGLSLLNGKGELLTFGGQVMKNVAGYDVSRLMVGAMGTLGLITDVSLRVIPETQLTATRSFEVNPAQALDKMRLLAQQNFPVSATCYVDERLYVRLSGEESSIGEAQLELGGESEASAEGFWEKLREQQMLFFITDESLWRFSVPPSAPLTENQEMVIEWGGAQRWYKGVEAGWLRATAAKVGGHATLFRTGKVEGDRFQPLDPAISKIHQNIKNAFDPAGIFNAGRMYADI